MEFAVNHSVHASTGETPVYVNGLRHPRTPVSCVRSPSLSGGGPLRTLRANTEKRNGFANVMAETCSSDPFSAAVVTTQECVKSESLYTLSVLQSNADRSSLAATTLDRPVGGVIGDLDAKSIQEAQRFVDERLAIKRKVRDVMASAQDKQKQYADQFGCRNREHFIVGDKVLISTSTLPKHVVSVLPGGTTGLFTVVEDVKDLNYRLTLSPYRKTQFRIVLGSSKAICRSTKDHVSSWV